MSGKRTEDAPVDGPEAVADQATYSNEAESERADSTDGAWGDKEAADLTASTEAGSFRALQIMQQFQPDARETAPTLIIGDDDDDELPGLPAMRQMYRQSTAGRASATAADAQPPTAPTDPDTDPDPEPDPEPDPDLEPTAETPLQVVPPRRPKREPAPVPPQVTPVDLLTVAMVVMAVTLVGVSMMMLLVVLVLFT